MLKNLKQSNSGFVLLMSIVITLFVSLMLAAAFLRTDSQQRFTVQRQGVQEAFYAAEAGVDRSVYELRINPLWDPGSGGIPPVVNESLDVIPGNHTSAIGYYSLDVEDGPYLTNLGPTKWVRSIGRDKLSDVPRVIIAQILVDDPTRFMISTPGDLTIRSGADLDADVLGRKLSFEINTYLPPAARHITVGGDALYVQDMSPACLKTDKHCNPDITISGAAAQYPVITFPGVDMTRYRAIASNRTIGFMKSGDFTVDLDDLGALTGDPTFKPSIIVATGGGNIHVRGTYDHSILIVAEGNLYIDGNIRPIRGSPKYIGLFGNKDVIIPAGTAGRSLTVENAFVLANGDGTSYGEFRAEDLDNTLGTLRYSGSISVRGESSTTDSINLTAFATRNYSHVSNMAVPYSPYIANILSWKEATLATPFP